MAHAQLEPVVRHLHRLARTHCTHDLSDAQLLQRFAAHREEAAFAALVERHGRLVLGVCRRVLRHEQDAEDAFQATFLVLARQAAAIHKTEAVGSWLYRVAYRIAVKAGGAMARRRAREREVGSRLPTEAPSEAGWRELQEVLQEELARLPEKYRAPFVHCCLEGRSGAEAAGLLGWKEGTVTGRLCQARKLLQQRLARRGVVLTAVLTAAALTTRSAMAEVPAVLAHATVKAAPLFIVGKEAAGGAVSATVASLVRGAGRMVFLSNAKVATALLLVVALVTGAGVLTHQALAGKQDAAPQAEAAEPPARDAQPPMAPAGKGNAAPAVLPQEADPSVELSGTVLGPDGKPFAGADLYLWTKAVKQKADLTVRATTGSDGRFHLTLARPDLEKGAELVAVAKDCGPDWVDAAEIAKGGELTLRLERDDVPITGRVLDLEARPIPGVTVEVGRLEQGDLKPWIEVRLRGGYSELRSVGPEILDGTTSATTDKDGRFRLTGFGRERVVLLRLHGANIENALFWVLTRTERVPGLRGGNHGTYSAAFEHVAGPGKLIVGTVREKGSRKPLAGITVVSASHGAVYAKTDAQGCYRIVGEGKHEEYAVAAGGVPYFTHTKMHIADTLDLEPVTVDFDLERGVALRGRLLDKATGKPVNGVVDYAYLPDNPNLKDFSDVTMPALISMNRGKTAADGSFTVVAVPGPGLLCAQADDAGRYRGADLKDLPTGGLFLDPYHAVVRIDPSEKDRKSTTRDIVLEPGRTLTGSLIGPDGRALAGAHAAGLTAIYQVGAHEKLDTAAFTAGGLDPQRPRALLFVHLEKKLGKVQRLQGDEADPLTVCLDPLGTVAGRVVSAGGRPRLGVKVSVVLDMRKEQYRGLPIELLHDYPTWGNLLNREATTGDDGRFRVEGLVPGLPYMLHVNENEIIKEGSALESGKTRDLGDLKSTDVPGKEEREK